MASDLNTVLGNLGEQAITGFSGGGTGGGGGGSWPAVTSPTAIVSSRTAPVTRKINNQSEAKKAATALDSFGKAAAAPKPEIYTLPATPGMADPNAAPTAAAANAPTAPTSSNPYGTPPLPGLAYNPADGKWHDPLSGSVWNGTNLVDPNTMTATPSSAINSATSDITNGNYATLKSNADSALATYTAATSGIGQPLSAADQDKIDAQARAAGAQYDTLITDAKTSKEQGMAKATVGAGQAGGFLNSQFSGAAAYAPTEGGNFVGAGGDLERTQSAYDDAITKLNVQRDAAMTQARIAAETAIRTGKADDLTALKTAFEEAQKAYTDSVNLTDTHAQNIANLQSTQKQNQAGIAVSPGTTLIDPATGKEIYQAPFKPGMPKFFTDASGHVTAVDPITKDKKDLGVIGKGNAPKFFTDNAGNVSMYDPATQTTTSVGDIGKTSTTQNPQVIDGIADAVLSGQVSLGALGGYGGAKNAIIAKVLEKNPSFNVTDNTLNYEAQKKYTDYINSPAYQNTIKYLDSVNYSLQTVQDLSSSINRTQFPKINKVILETMKQTGDPKVVAYATAVTETADQIAKILQGGGTGSSSSDSKLKQAQELFDGSYSPEQLNAAIDSIKSLLQNRADALTADTWKTIGGTNSNNPFDGGGSANSPSVPTPTGSSSSSSSAFGW